MSAQPEQVPDCPECGGSTPLGMDPTYAHTEDCSQHVDNRPQADDMPDRRDPSLPTYDPRAALAECLDVWGSGAWADENAVYDLAEVMGHVERLLKV